MTCFVAHLKKKGYFEPLGIRVTKDNAKDIEKEIARTVGMQGEHCPAIWNETKAWLADSKKKAVLDRNLKKRFASKPGA
jgi:BioD-like phosphotransacetylase family protein